MASGPGEEEGACERHEDYRKTRRREKSANKHFPHHHNYPSDWTVKWGKGGGGGYGTWIGNIYTEAESGRVCCQNSKVE